MKTQIDEHALASLVSSKGGSGGNVLRDRVVGIAAANPTWRAEYTNAIHLAVALEREVALRWPGRVRCLYVHSEIGNVAIVFAGEVGLRNAVLRLVPRGALLQTNYISLDAHGRQWHLSLANELPCVHDGLGNAEREFINFLVDRALEQWTPEI